MSERIVQLLQATPLRDASPTVLIASALVAAPVLAILLNVAAQLLLPGDASAPPKIFHLVPFLGSAVQYGMDPYAFFIKNREKYGDVYTFKLMGRNVTVALGAKGSNLIFNGRLSEVSAEGAYKDLTVPVFGKEVVYDVPNAVLMEQKKFVKVGLSTDNFRVYVGQIVEEVSNFIQADDGFDAVRKGNGQGPVNIFKAMCEITILTASRTLQGREVRDSLDKTFADLYHDLDGGFTPINFAIPGLPLPANFRRDRAQRAMSDFYLSIIEKRRKESGDLTDHDMIAALMEQSYKNGRKLGDREIAHIMIALLMAGQHTSSATGSWAMLRLASRPELIEELYAEQQQAYSNGEGDLRDLDYETQKTSVPLLDAVVKETLRLHPPIHSIMREVVSPIAVPPTLAAPTKTKNAAATYVIPKGNFVMAAPCISQIDPAVWRDPNQFDPKRWLGQGELVKEAEGEQVDFGWGVISSGANSPYLPFGAGRHRCIGEQFAYLQLGTIISTFVRRYSWKLNTEFPEPNYASMVTLPKAGDNLYMTERSSSA